MTKLDAPVACASQGAIELLGDEQNPQQDTRLNSRLKLPQNRFGTETPVPKKEVGTDV